MYGGTVYPIDYNYAHAMCILHKPWSMENPLDVSDKDKTIDLFKYMLHFNQLPTSVVCQYQRAVAYSSNHIKIEVISKSGLQEIYGDTNDDSDDNLVDYVSSCNHFTDQFGSFNDLHTTLVDFGQKYDWTTIHFKKSRDIEISGELYLQSVIKEYHDYQEFHATENDVLNIPKLLNGMEYLLNDLCHEKKL